MTIVLPLFIGIFIAMLASLLPGLINMTAAKISIKEGKNFALSFMFGALIIVFFHAVIAILFARFISKHLEIISMLQEIGLVIFTLLSIYFFWIAKKPQKPKTKLKVKGKSNRFFFGMFVSVLNVLPIPFYVFTSMSLASTSYFSFERIPMTSFIIGILIGTFIVYYAYIIAFKLIEKKTKFLLKNFNSILGTVTTLIAVFTFLKIIYH